MRKKIIGIFVCMLVITTGFSFDVLAKQNNPPNKPSTPSGPTSGKVLLTYFYQSSTTDPDGDQVTYWFDWGDGNSSGWMGPYTSGSYCETEYAWGKYGIYTIRVKAMDMSGAESPWSDPLTVTIIGENPSGRITSIYIGLIKGKQWDMIKTLFFTCITVLHILFYNGHIQSFQILKNYYARVNCLEYARIGIISRHIICCIFFEKTP